MREKIKKICFYLKMIKLYRIRHVFSVLKEEGLTGIRYRFYLVKDKEKGREQNGRREYDISPIGENGTFPSLTFKECLRPAVSIIIPAYNQFAYTYCCLQHIQKYAKDVDFEVIVGDDCSTDETARLEEIARGITVIHNKVNYQFLENCNRISKEAKGKYLLFLNNDTQVQKGWLKALVDLMENDETIGLSGSKLIYPTGLVQEAGGIVWKDASVLQFGNYRQPGEEELNRKREVDYISGASIMIRKKLWEEIGGFDVRFAPAYYEDVDLAFQVRKKGYRVVYQPESEVVHFVGLTEGADAKLKERIEKNRKVFVDKWKEVLGSRHYEPCEYEKAVRRQYSLH